MGTVSMNQSGTLGKHNPTDTPNCRVSLAYASGLAARWLSTKDKTFDKEQFRVIDNARVPLGHRAPLLLTRSLGVYRPHRTQAESLLFVLIISLTRLKGVKFGGQNLALFCCTCVLETQSPVCFISGFFLSYP